MADESLVVVIATHEDDGLRFELCVPRAGLGAVKDGSVERITSTAMVQVTRIDASV